MDLMMSDYYMLNAVLIPDYFPKMIMKKEEKYGLEEFN